MRTRICFENGNQRSFFQCLESRHIEGKWMWIVILESEIRKLEMKILILEKGGNPFLTKKKEAKERDSHIKNREGISKYKKIIEKWRF